MISERPVSTTTGLKESQRKAISSKKNSKTVFSRHPYTADIAAMGFEPPKFSGQKGENVEQYIKQCRFMWNATNCLEEELDEARAMQLYAGLTGSAASFMNRQGQAVIGNFKSASDALLKAFPWDQSLMDDEDDILERVLALKQDKLSFDQYVEEGMKLKVLSTPGQLPILCKRWVQGLEDTLISTIAFSKVKSWHAKDKLTFDRVVAISRGPNTFPTTVS